jgi:hypothetical protein
MVQGKTRAVNHKQIFTPPDQWVTVRGTHEPIISREMFADVQLYRTKAADESTVNPVEPYTPNIFKGKIFCGICGGRLNRHVGWKRKGERVYVFECLSNTRKARGSCKSFCIQEDKLVDTLLTVIHKQAGAVIGERLYHLKAQAGAMPNGAVKSELAALRQAIGKGKRLLKTLYENLVTGIITDEDYYGLKTSYEAEIAKQQTRADELQQELRRLEARTSEYIELSGFIAGVKNRLDITTALVDRLVDRIRAFPNGHIEVDFLFSSGFEGICGEMQDE